MNVGRYNAGEYRKLRLAAEDYVKSEAREFVQQRLGWLGARGYTEGDAWAEIAEWTGSDACHEFIDERVDQVTRKLIDPRAPAVLQ